MGIADEVSGNPCLLSFRFCAIEETVIFIVISLVGNFLTRRASSSEVGDVRLTWSSCHNACCRKV